MVNESLFENLAREGYEVTSKVDPFHNCIAYAAGVEDEWWDPLGVWPDDVPQDDTVEALIKVYERAGFAECSNGDAENGFDKIAIYGKGGVYEHAAKLRDDGRWGSKMGPDDDIAHPTLSALEGSYYGQVVAFMRRPAK